MRYLWKLLLNNQQKNTKYINNMWDSDKCLKKKTSPCHRGMCYFEQKIHKNPVGIPVNRMGTYSDSDESVNYDIHFSGSWNGGEVLESTCSLWPWKLDFPQYLYLGKDLTLQETSLVIIKWTLLSKFHGNLKDQL